MEAKAIANTGAAVGTRANLALLPGKRKIATKDAFVISILNDTLRWLSEIERRDSQAKDARKR